MQGKSGFARRFRAVYFGHAAARHAANAKGKVEADGAGGNDGNLYMCAVGKLHDSALTILAFDGAECRFERLAAGVFSGNERLFGHDRYLPVQKMNWGDLLIESMLMERRFELFLKIQAITIGL